MSTSIVLCDKVIEQLFYVRHEILTKIGVVKSKRAICLEWGEGNANDCF